MSASSVSASSSARDIVTNFFSAYKKNTSNTIQLLDTFIVFSLLTGVLQLLYVLLVGQFPFNSFLAGLCSCVGFFIFTVCLRLQVSNPHEFHGISKERAYADFVVCNLLLFFVVFTFIG